MMPIKLSLGLSKKIGQPDYGSLGASCSLELELESTLLQSDLEAFHRQVRSAYAACRQAVNDELTRQQQVRLDTSDEPGHSSGGYHRAGNHNGNGASRAPHAAPGNNGAGHGNGNGSGHQGPSPKQLEYISQLARQIRGLGVRRLENLAERMFGKTPAELTGFEASALIDQLKAVKSGQLDLDEALGAGAQA